MNHSTKDVTLWAAFILDILREVKKLNYDTSNLEKICEAQDLSSPYNLIPIQVYNDMCTWVEEQLGSKVIIQVGKSVGETVYNTLKENTIIDEHSTPLEIMEALMVAAESMIHDPEGRGWEVMNQGEGFILMRRTQTFNGRLQFGLLEGLVSKVPSVNRIEVGYAQEIAQGAEFDEYLIKWIS